MFNVSNAIKKAQQAKANAISRQMAEDIRLANFKNNPEAWGFTNKEEPFIPAGTVMQDPSKTPSAPPVMEDPSRNTSIPSLPVPKGDNSPSVNQSTTQSFTPSSSANPKAQQKKWLYVAIAVVAIVTIVYFLKRKK